jgi:F0F1-type ATP synthase delta subunit
MNLGKIRQMAQGYDQLSKEQKGTIDSQVKSALARIDQEPKSLAWRLRSRVGDRVKWYKDVDEVQ